MRGSRNPPSAHCPREAKCSAQLLCYKTALGPVFVRDCPRRCFPCTVDFPPPPGLDLSESRRANLYAAYSSTYGLAVVAVVLRLWCRTRVSKVGLWWDDYLICLVLASITDALLMLSKAI
jgi:hypothetical protein